jgi:hypothetical protein
VIDVFLGIESVIGNEVGIIIKVQTFFDPLDA